MATLNIREIDDAAAERVRRLAGMAGLTLGQYIDKVSWIHAEALMPDVRNRSIYEVFDKIGLGTPEAK